MIPEQWERLQDIFDRAIHIDRVERAAFLDVACGDDRGLRARVDRLLASHDREGPLDRLEEELVPHMRQALPESEPGTRVGPYRIIRSLGQGGMGVVYLAERDDEQFSQQVALKIVRSGFQSHEIVDRFLHERQILAQLSHAHITRLLDGGVTQSGVPYFAMEYVEGEPIDEYCDRQRHTVYQRIALFLTVCDTIQYAHQNLVVHRDIKPSNLLVTADGVIKVLDFGIAKLLGADADRSAETRTGQRWMTPDYASPEQVRGQPVTTASDVFSLGVVLYELLTGRRPHHFETTSPGEIERVICETDPTRPSTAITADRGSAGTTHPSAPNPETVSRARGVAPDKLKRQLAGDLDTIVLRALRKEPERRYGSANELADDLRRHLAGLPVHARPDTIGYRLTKFVGRHRVSVTAAGLIALALVGGIAGTTTQAQRASRQAELAAAERDKAQQVSDFVIDLFRVADPRETLGAELSARELVDSGAVRLERDLAGQPGVQATLMDVLGRIYEGLGRYPDALSLFSRSLDRLEREERPDSLARAQTLTRLANAFLLIGQPDSAEPLIREALRIRRTRLGPDHGDVAAALNDLGGFFHRRQQLDSAEAYYRHAIAMRRRLGDDTGSDFAVNLSNLAGALSQQGNFEAADSIGREALSLRRTVLPAIHPEIAQSLNNLGVNRYRMGDLPGARDYLAEAAEIRRAVLGPDHPEVAEGLNNLASVTERMGDLEAAEELYREALSIKLRAFDQDHPSTARTMNNLGLLLEQRGQLDDAETYLRLSLAMRRRVLGDTHPELAVAQHNLGVFLRRTTRGDGTPFLREAVAVRATQLGEGHWRTADSEAELGAALTQAGRYEEAERYLVRSYEVLHGMFGADDPRTQRSIEHLVHLYEVWKRLDAAAEYRAQMRPAATGSP